MATGRAIVLSILLLALSSLSDSTSLNSSDSSFNARNSLTLTHAHAPPSFSERDVPPCMTERYRTLLDIVKSCLVTIIACNWVAVHPNIPGPTEPGKTTLKQRLVMMFYSILAPEMVILWALRQRSGAKLIKNAINEGFGLKNKSDSKKRQWCIRKFLKLIYETKAWWCSFWKQRPTEVRGPWTYRHGFYVEMGGFMLYDEHNDPICVLSAHDLIQLVQNSDIDIPAISEEDIKDKSKGSLFHKTIGLFQSGFFAYRCTNRVFKRLPITPLELSTVSFVMLNVLMYYFWLNKPYEVELPTRIFLKTNEKRKTDGNTGGYSTYALELLRSAKANDPPLERKTWICRCIMKDYRAALERKGQWWFLWFLLWRLPGRLFRGFMRPLAKMIDEKQAPPGYPRVRMFGSVELNKDFIPVVSQGLALGIVFGVFHIMAFRWCTFPPSIEVLLWTSCAIVITAAPVLTMTILGWSYLDSMWKGSSKRKGRTVLKLLSWFGRCVAVLLWFLEGIIVPVFVIARLILLVLMFTTLRDLPIGVYQEDGGSHVPWF